MIKNKREIINYILLFIITTLVGVLFHYLYSLCNQNVLIGIFTPVNESIFEHLKLLFFPFILMSAIEIIINNKSFKNLMPYRIFYITLSLFILPMIYYSLEAISIKFAFINIFLYIILIAFVCFLSYQQEKKQLIPNKNIVVISLLLFTLLFILFILMTFYPPEIELFRDPLNDSYGILR